MTTVLRVTTRHVDGSMCEFDVGQELLDALRDLQAQGLEGKRLIHQLLTDDWAAPPVLVDITGIDDAGQVVEVRIPYR